MVSERVRCTNCGSDMVLPEGADEFVKCDSCGCTFSVARAREFIKVELSRSQDIRAWREYLANQLKLRQDNTKAQDYSAVQLFARKILSVLPDDFRALYYAALAERYSGDDAGYVEFLKSVSFNGVGPDAKKEVVESVIDHVEPKYLELIRAFVFRAYPATAQGFEEELERNIKAYIHNQSVARMIERDVFICHADTPADLEMSDAICSRLEERGLHCWIAPRNILAGSQDHGRDVLNGLESCRMTLIVASKDALLSDECEAMVKAAALSGKTLYSYKTDETPYEGYFLRALGDAHGIDASDAPYAYIDQMVIDVVGILAHDEPATPLLEQRRMAALELGMREKEERRLLESGKGERLAALAKLRVEEKDAPAAIAKRLKSAEQEIAAGRFEKAVSILEEALEADPENPLAWLLLAFCDMRAVGSGALASSSVDYTANKYYKNAEKFASREPAVERHIKDLNEKYIFRVVRKVSTELGKAEEQLHIGEFTELDESLKRCEPAFANEESLIFSRFPELASRYYWIKLWSKFRQTYTVCVEDITREIEYHWAIKYATPLQVEEYSRETSIVSKNAQAFLRERSKYLSNDERLMAYLEDNRNILPVDVYKYYASLLYFRRMLNSHNITEAELQHSTINIAVDENFILACSLANEEQKQRYDAYILTTERNRRDEEARIAEETRKHDAATERKAEIHKLHGRLKSGAEFAGTLVALLLFLLGIIMMREISNEGLDNIIVVLVMFAVSAFMKTVGDCIALFEHGRLSMVFTTANFAMGAAMIAVVLVRISPKITLHALEQGWREIMSFYWFVLLLNGVGVFLEFLKIILNKHYHKKPEEKQEETPAAQSDKKDTSAA